LKFYTKALLKSYGRLVAFPKTGKRGRPRKPKLVIDDRLRCAQVIKSEAGGAVREAKKKAIFKKDINPKDISTSLVERQNLTLRQDNNRISRKTIGFSKKLSELDKQMTLYFARFNFCREHGSLISLDCFGRKKKHLSERMWFDRPQPVVEGAVDLSLSQNINQLKVQYQASDIVNEFGKKGSNTAAGKRGSRRVITEKSDFGKMDLRKADQIEAIRGSFNEGLARGDVRE